jgi:hypothetical protein
MSEMPFGQRHGLCGPPVGTLVREDAPNGLRTKLVEVLTSMSPSSLGHDFDGVKLRDLFRQVMNIRPPANISNLLDGYDAFEEAKRLLYDCEWFQFYEIVEELSQLLRKEDRPDTRFARVPQRGVVFAEAVNEAFVRWNIGWQLVDGRVILRGNDVFEGTVKTAVAVLEEDSKPTAAGHLRFAISALSAKPRPDTGGAVGHATNAVECVLGEITGQAMTLGQYLDKHRGLFHQSLRKGLDGIYGYASDEGARHGKEGTEPALEEAEFAVAACAAVCTLLTRKHPK